MTNDALLVVKCLFGTIWRLFTSWYIPGTMVTPATAALFFAAAGISLRFVLNLFHSPGASATGGMIGYKMTKDADYRNKQNNRGIY